MRRLSVLVAMGALLLVAFLVPGASAKNADFLAPLSHAQEVAKIDAPGAGGFAEFSVDGLTLQYRVMVRRLTGPATQAHIHAPAERHVNAGVDIWLCGTGTAGFAGPAGTPTCNATTSGLLVQGSVTVTLLQLDRLQAGRGYANVHTAAHPPGEVRGQLLPVGP